MLISLFLDKWKPYWSKVYWSNIAIDENQEFTIPPILTKPLKYYFNTLNKKLYKNFTYTYDNLLQLGDSIMPPVYAYYQLSNNVLKGDCDDYHSALSYVCYKNNLEYELITIVTKPAKYSHTFLLVHMGTSWYVVDYTNITGASSTKTKEKVLEDYIEQYKEKNSCKVIYQNSMAYDYDKEEFII